MICNFLRNLVLMLHLAALGLTRRRVKVARNLTLIAPHLEALELVP